MFLVFLLFFLYPKQTLAYLDPGTGSMVLQIVVGSVLVAFYAVKVYWQRLKSFFKKK